MDSGSSGHGRSSIFYKNGDMNGLCKQYCYTDVE